MADHISSVANTTADNSNVVMNDTVGNGGEAEKATVASNGGRNRKADPFGDESKSEIKYRTLHWW